MNVVSLSGGFELQKVNNFKNNSVSPWQLSHNSSFLIVCSGERKPKIDLFRTCVAALPRILPDGNVAPGTDRSSFPGWRSIWTIELGKWVQLQWFYITKRSPNAHQTHTKRSPNACQTLFISMKWIPSDQFSVYLIAYNFTKTLDQGSNCEKWSGGSATQQEPKGLGGWGGSQWNEQGNWRG